MVTEVIADQALTAGERRHLGALERRIEQGLQTFREVGQALLEIRETRLYRDDYPSFEAYAADRWQLDKQRAYQFIGAAQVVKVLGDPEELRNEAQAREFVPLLGNGDEKMIKTIWQRVEATNEPVTAALIRRVKAEVMPLPTPVSDTDRLVARLVQVAEAMRRWQGGKHTRKDKAAVTGAMEHLQEVYAG